MLFPFVLMDEVVNIVRKCAEQAYTNHKRGKDLKDKCDVLRQFRMVDNWQEIHWIWLLLQLSHEV